MNNKIKIGIIGYGIIGQALVNWLKNNNQNISVKINDPFKNFNDSLEKCDAYFINIHISTENDGSQNLELLKNIINKLPNNILIWIRTTILPGTCDLLSKETNHIIYHMPEFLTERTCFDDFNYQPIIFTGTQKHIELLKKIFPGKKYLIMSSAEAEMVKYAHNVFGALKITYFNCIYDICQQQNLNYETVRKGILGSTYINDVHTQVPGPDGKLGYGGKCFPKDVDAFEKMFRYTPLGRLLDPLKKLNTEFRGIDN